MKRGVIRKAVARRNGCFVGLSALTILKQPIEDIQTVSRWCARPDTDTSPILHTTPPPYTMESPSIHISNPIEDSAFNVDGPPSSPFQSLIDGASRSPSKQHKPSLGDIALDAIDENVAMPQEAYSPDKASFIDFTDFMDDKENVPQEEPTATKISVSPKKVTTPGSVKSVRSAAPSEKDMEQRRGSKDSDIMPPPTPSTRKTPSRTPKKTPLQSKRGAESTTPRTLTRGNSYERADPTPRRTPSLFQAGLDLRASTMQGPDATNIDDTCFSTFSEIPEMTIFAKLGQSPTRRGDMTRTPGREVAPTPSTSRKRLSSSSRSPSPTPRRRRTPNRGSDDTTNLLLDFTQQIEGISRPNALVSPSKSSTEPNLLQYINNQRSPHKRGQSLVTPGKQSNLLNLLDFELPPAPTPRSIPTITVRELESLKSSYLSQISSLKATLSGREAEVESLKRAVNDAERRVGESQEELREEKDARAHAESEKAGWVKRGQEVELVLKSVKEEVMRTETEKEDLLRKIEDAERRIDNAEARAIKAEERFADALAARADPGEGGSSATEEQVQKLVAAQIDAKIEAVSRELHAVYKDKHERKVGTLKKSYEARGEKRCAGLQRRLDAMQRENEDLHAARDATFTGPVSGGGISNEESVALKSELEEQRAHLARLENEIRTSQQQQAVLARDLERERIEKGDLVAAVDEMLALQSEAGPSHAQRAEQSQIQGAISVVEDFRKSISRPSGLKPPAAVESRIGRGGATPGNAARGGAGGKSRMLANIERMGRAGEH
jgi:hypothetical protein